MFFSIPGSNGRSMSTPSLYHPPVLCINCSCVTPDFLISVSKYSMSDITSSDTGVSLGGKISFPRTSWDISADSGHGIEEALKRARTSKMVEALMCNVSPIQRLFTFWSNLSWGS